MKKLLSILLTVVILMSAVSCLTVSAEETFPPLETGIYSNLNLEDYSIIYSEKQPQVLTPDTETAQKIEEFKQSYVEKHSYIESADLIDVYYFGTLDDGSMLLYCSYGASLTAIEYVVVGKYVYVNAYINNEVKICRNNELLRVVDEYKAGNITDEQLDEIADILCYHEFANSNEAQPESTLPLYGDVYTDKKISITDATQLCKHLAELTTLSDEQLIVADYNGDESIDIKDATDIQKMLAGLDYKYTHELYEVEPLKFSTDDLSSVPFTLSKRENASYGGSDEDYCYINKSSSLTTLFKTYDEYSRFFDATLEEYDEEFFEDNSIIFLYDYYTSGSIRNTVDNVYVKDNILYLETTHWLPEDGWYTDDIANWNLFYAVNRADVENVEKICIKGSTSYYTDISDLRGL